MNVRDDQLPTNVNATLSVGGEPGVRIKSITGDNNGQLNFHSIPRPEATNDYERAFTVEYTKPKNSKVKNVKVALSDGKWDLITVLDEAPGGGAVKLIGEKTLKVRVSHHKANPSTLNSQPPSFHELKYRIKLTVDVDGIEVTDEKDSGVRRGLWRMPDGFERYGDRDKGGDDWASKGAYEWLEKIRI